MIKNKTQAHVCHFQDPSRLEGRVTLRQVTAGSVVAHQGDQVSVPGKTCKRGKYVSLDLMLLLKMPLHFLVETKNVHIQLEIGLEKYKHCF